MLIINLKQAKMAGTSQTSYPRIEEMLIALMSIIFCFLNNAKSPPKTVGHSVLIFETYKFIDLQHLESVVGISRAISSKVASLNTA